jgi:myosin heavy subunit
MLEQLRYSGVLEVVRIRREGFPWKNSYLGFYKEFEMLTVHEQHIGEYPPVNKCSEARAREITQALCSQYLGAPSASGENVGKDLYACGATRMYMREEGFNHLSQHLNLHFERCAAFIQARIRRIQHVKFFQYSLQMIVKLQAWARMRAKVTWKALELARIAHEAAVEAARIAHEAAVEAARLQALEEERQLQQLEKAERERILAEKEAARVAAEEAEKERLRLIEEAEKERLRLIEVAIQADKKLLNDFTLATEGGDVAAMKALLADHPDLATRKSELPGALPHTPFQNACYGGAMRVWCLTSAQKQRKAKSWQEYPAQLGVCR